jgi:uncharacterized membrane protein (UPF0127 family)
LARITCRLSERAGVAVLCVAPLFSACDRSEGIRATQTAGTATSSTPAPTAAPSCLVPTPDQPPEPQKPASTCPADPGAPPDLARAEVSFPEAPGNPRVGVELARQSSEQARGLMYRTSMPEEQGMLFSWNDEAVRSFWMRNTCIPLDMMFIARDGTIAGIQEQVPVLNDMPRSIPCPAAHVLEVNAGWSRRHGVRAGMHAVLE